MTAIKTIERPILFSGQMVRAILSGSKTQTRRVLNFVRGFGGISEYGVSDTPGYAWQFRDHRKRWNELRHDALLAACPFGVVGDLLRVREKWRCHLGDIDDPLTLNYAADDSVRDIDRDSVQWEPSESLLDWKWKPSIHMPRWATRLWLVITDVRVARLQSISESDAEAEGVDTIAIPSAQASLSHRTAFAGLWTKLNTIGSQWKDNPWVWAISFRRIQ